MDQYLRGIKFIGEERDLTRGSNLSQRRIHTITSTGFNFFFKISIVPHFQLIPMKALHWKNVLKHTHIHGIFCI